MSATWIIVADSSRARVLSPIDEERRPLDEVVEFVGRAGYVGPEKLTEDRLEEVESLVHPEGRLGRHDTQSDRPGVARTPGGAETYEPTHKDFKHQVAEDFVREIVDYLSEARAAKRFERLIVVAPPLFLGTLRKMLTPGLKQLVAMEIDKDYTKLSIHDIRAHLPEQL